VGERDNMIKDRTVVETSYDLEGRGISGEATVMATTTAESVVSIYDHSGWVGGDNTQFK
jgi:hypothetical protein